jgi:hypothetical protein
MSVNLSPIFNAVAQTNSTGLPLNGGFLYTYLAGSSTPLATYTDSAGSVPNTNPIILGTDGRPPYEIWLNNAYGYKFVLTDSASNLIGTYDNVFGSSSYYGPSTAVTAVTGTSPISVTSGNTPNVSFSGVLGRTNGGTGVSSPPVAFVHQITAQSIASSTVTVIQYETVNYDTNSIWLQSNYAFVPNVPGYYQVNVSCTISSTSAGYQVGCGVLQNNSTLVDYNVAASSALGSTPVCSTIVKCNGSTDYIQGVVAQSSGGSLSTTPSTVADTTFSIAFLRGL